MTILQFISLPMDTWAVFNFDTDVNKTFMNILIQGFLWTFIFLLDKYLEVGLLGLN